MSIPPIRRRLLLAALGSGLAPAALAQPATGWRARFPVVGFGILSVENQGATIARFQGFPAYFRSRLGVDCRIFQATDYAGVVQALTGGQIQMARLGPASYAAAWIDSDGAVEPLVTWTAPSGQAGYFSVLIVRADSPFQRLEDLRGRTIAWADPNSTSGYLVPLATLRGMNIEPSRFFGRTVFSGGHEQSVLGVLNGNFDAAFTWTAEDDAFGQLRMMIDRGLLQRDRIRVVLQSPLIPNPPVTVRKDLPADMKADLRAFFLDMARDNMEMAEAVAAGRTTGFIEANEEMYRPIVEVALIQREQRRQRRG
ncbi:MAG: phosphonate ABC transporter substrate-binding protein [Rhodovarius sp.]|nr:phosphonate ABC transporter substrate-binding protein [Rhodovarius sp.]MCX7931311.1 phosphonate ABC transporter substrate-binding protein [Rhodovarius sp.]MDW8315832.1 phosphonate ABC transporter substrate-binding protein [Rhodovarius sp.]